MSSSHEFLTWGTRSLGVHVKEQIFEQASNTLHHINRAKLFTENSLPWLGSGISLGVGGQLTPKIYWSPCGPCGLFMCHIILSAQFSSTAYKHILKNV